MQQTKPAATNRARCNDSTRRGALTAAWQCGTADARCADAEVACMVPRDKWRPRSHVLHHRPLRVASLSVAFCAVVRCVVARLHRCPLHVTSSPVASLSVACCIAAPCHLEAAQRDRLANRHARLQRRQRRRARSAPARRLRHHLVCERACVRVRACACVRAWVHACLCACVCACSWVRRRASGRASVPACTCCPWHEPALRRRVCVCRQAVRREGGRVDGVQGCGACV